MGRYIAAVMGQTLAAHNDDVPLFGWTVLALVFVDELLAMALA
jgi:hypothetical protein